ncbi:hypothetical protein EIN_225840, partial [Entamoeba invadens IP1]
DTSVYYLPVSIHLQCPIDIPGLSLKDNLSTLFQKTVWTQTLFKTLQQLTTIPNLTKFDYLSIRNLVSSLKALKPIDASGSIANPLFALGTEVLAKILKYQASQEIIQNLVDFYREIPPIHAAVFLDSIQGKYPSEMYYSFPGIASLVNFVVTVEKLPSDCYTLATSIRFPQLNTETTPCIFSVTANNYFYSLNIDGKTNTALLDVNIVSSSYGNGKNVSTSPATIATKETYTTHLTLLPEKWNEIFLIHFKTNNLMKVVINSESSQEFDVPFIPHKVKNLSFSIGGLMGKSYSYFKGDVAQFAWYYGQVSPCGIPTFLISPKNYSAVTSHSSVRELHTIKNRVASKEVKIVESMIISGAPIYVVVTRSIADIFGTYGGISSFLPLLRCGNNAKVTTNIGKIIHLFLHCKYIDPETATTLIKETASIAQSYVVNTSIVDDYIKLCMSLITRGYCTETILPLLIDIRLWRGVEYLFDYFVQELIQKCAKLDEKCFEGAVEEMTLLNISFDKMCSVDEKWKYSYITFLASMLPNTILPLLFSFLQNPNVSNGQLENGVILLINIIQKYHELFIQLNGQITVFISLSQKSKNLALLVAKLVSYLQPTSDQFLQLTQILAIFPFDEKTYFSLLQCTAGKVTPSFSEFSVTQMLTLQNPQFLFITFTLLASQRSFPERVVDDLLLFPSAILNNLPISFLTEVARTAFQTTSNDNPSSDKISEVVKTKVSQFLVNIVISRELEIFSLFVSFFITSSSSAKNLLFASLPFLRQIVLNMPHVSNELFIQILSYVGFLDCQVEVPKDYLKELYFALPQSFFSTYSKVSTQKDFKTTFYLQATMILKNPHLLKEDNLRQLLNLAPTHISALFCQFAVHQLKCTEKLQKVALELFGGMLAPQMFQSILESAHNTTFDESQYKSFMETFVLEYKETHIINMPKISTVSIPDVPLTLLPFDRDYIGFAIFDKIKQNFLKKRCKCVMKRAMDHSLFFQAKSEKYSGFREEFFNPLNPFFPSKMVDDPPIKVLSYESLYLPDNFPFTQIPFEGKDVVDCVLKKLSLCVCCKMTFDCQAKEIRLWTVSAVHILSSDDIREVYPRLSNGLMCAVEFVRRREKSYFVSFENEKVCSSVLTKVLNFFTKTKSFGVINPPKKVPQSIVKSWVEGTMTTYEYISAINNFSGRSLIVPDTYYTFPSIEDNEVLSMKEETLMEHAANTCCLLYTHMPFTKILPVFQLRIARPPATVKDIRMLAVNCIPQVYVSQKIYSGMGGTEDGISYGNKPVFATMSKPVTMKQASSPKLGSSALEVVYKKRMELEDVFIQEQIGNWIQLNFGKKGVCSIQGLVTKRKRCIDFKVDKRNLDQVSLFKDESNTQIYSINVQRNLMYQTEMNEVIWMQDKENKMKCVPSPDTVRKVCLDKYKNKVVVSYQMNADYVSMSWKEYKKSVRIENTISLCYLMETNYLTDLEMFVVTKAGSVMVYRILLDDKNNELKCTQVFTVFVGQSIKSFDVSTYYGFFVCNTSSTLVGYSVHDGSALFRVPSTCKIFCCSPLGNTFGITGDVLTCYDRYGEMYDIYELSDMKNKEYVSLACLACGFREVVFIATTTEVLVVLNQVNSFNIIGRINVEQKYPDFKIQALKTTPSIETTSNPTNWNVYVILIHKKLLYSTFIGLHVDCFKTMILK